jgi:outer membrane beta-barrel protein
MTNSRPRQFALFVSLCVAAGAMALPRAAQAQRRSPLADAPAIRKRVELRDTRLEVGAGFGSTVNQDFYHTMMLDVKLGFHFTDWLSVSAVGGFAVANLATGFQDRLSQTLMNETGMGRAPTATDAQASMSKITMMGAGQLEFTPFTGKYSLFGKIFAHYDFYAFGGIGVLNLSPTNSGVAAACVSGMTTAKLCGVSGFKPGGNVGLGLHSFFNQWIGLNVELRDIIAQINPSGRDVNGDGMANLDDLTWGSTFIASANIVVFLPSAAAISP